MNSLYGPLILHIPHSAARIPGAYRADFLLKDAELEEELLRMTDRYTEILFPRDYPRAEFPVSRLVCDPERFAADAEEPMAKIGMGCIYTHGSSGALIRPAADREALLKEFYYPHHRHLEQLTDRALAEHGACLILDCHSFSPVPLPYEPDRRMPRPDICIGTDSFHTPPELYEETAAFFRRAGLTVSQNSPYAGALVPLKHYCADRRVSAVMLELNRGLYMEPSGEKKPAFSDLQHLLEEYCTLLCTK